METQQDMGDVNEEKVEDTDKWFCRFCDVELEIIKVDKRIMDEYEADWDFMSEEERLEYLAELESGDYKKYGVTMKWLQCPKCGKIGIYEEYPAWVE